ncbi:MAG TPA: ABC transporter permease [Gemmatimonadales bacterium]|nr:ABC transporter permease [Gemmatimonadales bacterium]
MRELRKIGAVLRREFLSRVRTRAFVIGTVLGPLLMAGLMMFPAFLEKRHTRPAHVVVVDAASGTLGARVVERLAGEMRDTVTRTRPRYRVERVATAPAHVDAARDSLVALTRDTLADAARVDGILVLTDSGVASGRLQYYGTNVGSLREMERLQRTLTPLLFGERLARAGVPPAVVLGAFGRIDLAPVKVSNGAITGESGEASFVLAYAMSFILYLALLIYGMQVTMSTIEEKTNRIVEVLVASLSPFELMMGKVLGVAGVALAQLAIWGGTAMALTTWREAIAARLGVSAASLAALPIPTVSPALLGVFLLYFTLGFLFYAALYAAVGAMCNSTAEAQQSQMPITVCIMAGLFLMFQLIGDPSGGLARTLTFVPPFAPFVVPVRYSVSPLPAGTLLLSTATMVVGILVAVWLAARIYRVGILSYGKKPTLAELARWVRTA